MGRPVVAQKGLLRVLLRSLNFEVTGGGGELGGVVHRRVKGLACVLERYNLDRGFRRAWQGHWKKPVPCH